MENNQTLLFIFDWLIELRFYVPIDTKQVILETFFLANLLAQYWRTNLTQQKQTIREQNGINERQRNIQKANINVNLNLNEQLTIRTAHKSVGISLCTTVVHNTAENSSDNLPSYPLDNHHSSYVVYCRWGRLFIQNVCCCSVFWPPSCNKPQFSWIPAKPGVPTRRWLMTNRMVKTTNTSVHFTRHDTRGQRLTHRSVDAEAA